MKVLIWADEPDHALPIRQQLREAGHSASIRDARGFNGFGDVEKTEALAFVSASKREFIIAEYRSALYVERYGSDVRVFDVETGLFGEPIAPLLIEPVKTEPKKLEADFLSERIENLDDEALRVYASGILGQDIPAGVSREDMEAALRNGVAPKVVAPVEDEQKAQTPDAEQTPTPPATTETKPPPAPADGGNAFDEAGKGAAAKKTKTK